MSFYSDFAEHYDTIFPFEEEVHGFLKRRASPPGRALDIGCGTGDYCGRLARDGFDATGIDLDPWMIEAARRRHPAPTFRVMGMEEVGRLQGPFDLAFCIGNVASHLKQGLLQQFVRDVRTLLSPGGLWVVQTVNWDYALGRESLRFPDVTAGDGGLLFEREYPEISDERVVFATRLSSDGRTVFEGETTLHPVRSARYREIHEDAGFELAGHFGNFSEAPFDADTWSSSVFAYRARP